MIDRNFLTRYTLAVLAVGTSTLSSCNSGPATPVASSAPTIATSYGEWASFSLPEGWQVVLAPSSALRFPTGYGARHRMVEFDGEASFTIAHGEQPFVVRAGSTTMVARDPGTRFVVRSYPEEALTDVVVAQGSVVATHTSAASQGVDSVLVSPNFRARATSNGFVSLTPALPQASYAWALRPLSADSGITFQWDGSVLFQGTPLREVVSQVEHWHNIDINLALSAARSEAPFTGSFSNESPAEEVLRMIALVFDLEMTSTGPRTYILREK